jgi:hypothetical protein
VRRGLYGEIALRPGEGNRIWQRRFYDFNVWSEHKQVEKLRYIHRNPVKRGLVTSPEDWAWSSFRAYAYGEEGPVRVNVQEWMLKIRARARESFQDAAGGSSADAAGGLHTPLIRKRREWVGHPSELAPYVHNKKPRSRERGLALRRRRGCLDG